MIDWTQIRHERLGSLDNPIEGIEIPVLPAAVSAFSKMASDPECSAGSLASIVEKDAALTSSLLRMINSSAFGLRHRVANVQHAIAALGIRRAHLHVISLALQYALPKQKLRLLNSESFWNSNQERGHFARQMAPLLGANPDLAYAASLLQDFMLPALTNKYESVYVKYLRRDHGYSSLAEFEKDHFGWDHCETAARVMAKWRLPDDLICSVLFHHQGLVPLSHSEYRNTALSTAALAGLLPDALLQSPNGLQQLTELDEVWNDFSLQAAVDAVTGLTGQQAVGSSCHVSLHDYYIAWRAKHVMTTHSLPCSDVANC